MYRDRELRKYQYYIQPDWSGGQYLCSFVQGMHQLTSIRSDIGVYASPSMAGSR